MITYQNKQEVCLLCEYISPWHFIEISFANMNQLLSNLDAIL